MKFIFLISTMFLFGCSTLNFNNLTYKQKKNLKRGMTQGELKSVVGGTKPYHKKKSDDESIEHQYYYYDAEVNGVFVCETIVIKLKNSRVIDIKKQKDKYADQRCVSYSSSR